MSISLGDILLELGVDDGALGPALGGIEKKTLGWVTNMGGKLALGLGSLVTAAIGGAVALGVASFKAGETVDEAIDNIIVKTGATGSQLNTLQADFKAVFSSIPTDAGLASDVISILNTRLGLTGDVLRGTSTQLLEMSRVTKTDAIANTEAWTAILQQFNLTGGDTSGTLDMMFVASQKSGVGVDRLMQLVTQFGPPLRAMGFSLADSVALLANMEKAGVNSEAAMLGLRTAAAKFSGEGKPLNKGLEETIKAIKGAKTESAALALAYDVFGARSAPVMAEAIRSGKFNLQDMVVAISDADGAIADASKRTEDWGEKLQKFKNKATIALEPIGAKMMDLASTLLDKAAPAFDWLVVKLDQYVIPAVDTLAGALGKLMDGDLAGAIGAIFGGDTEAQAGALIKIVQDLFTALSGGDTGAVQNILTGLIGPDAAIGITSAITTIQTAWGNMMTFFQENGSGILSTLAGYFSTIFTQIGTFLASNVVPFLAQQFEKISAWFVANGPLIQSYLQAMTNFATTYVIPAVLGLWAVISPLLSGIVDLVLNLVTMLMQIFTGNWAGVWESAKTIVTGVFTTIMNTSLAFWNWIAGLFGSSLAQIGATWAGVWSAMNLTVSLVWQLIVAYLTGALASFSKWWTESWDGLVGWFDALPATFATIGANIVNGLWDGLKSVWDSISAWWDTNIGGLIDKAKLILGISSPSRVMWDMGINLGVGFSGGIQESMTAVTAKTGNLMSDLVGSLAGMPALQPAYASAGKAYPAQVITPAAAQTTEIHLHIGTLVADQRGLEALERKLRSIRQIEDVRRGL